MGHENLHNELCLDWLRDDLDLNLKSSAHPLLKRLFYRVEKNGEIVEMISHPLNDDPWHKPVELCFYKAGSDFLYFESVDQPLRDIEQEEESRDLATGFFISKTLGKNLKYDTFECFTFQWK